PSRISASTSGRERASPPRRRRSPRLAAPDYQPTAPHAHRGATVMAEPIKVLIADDMSKKAVEVLSKAGFTVEVKTGMKPEELAAVIGEYHAIGIRSASKITAATLEKPGKLK